MALTNASSAAGSSVEYVSTCLASGASCTLTSHFQGTLFGAGSSTCININGAAGLISSANSASHNIMCNVFLPKTTEITANGGCLAMVGCLIP